MIAQDCCLSNVEADMVKSLIRTNYHLEPLSEKRKQKKYDIPVMIEFVHDQNSILFQEFLLHLEKLLKENFIFQNECCSILQKSCWKPILISNCESKEFKIHNNLEPKNPDQIDITMNYIFPNGIMYYESYGLIFNGNKDYGSVTMYRNTDNGWKFVTSYRKPVLGDE
ncbi:hypothetical protein [Nonlabens sp. Asnod3-A02]|uniref:hypothetical protein n=1 Tax=Nonlabens sp. Asnod3-A02 TaxID=3160579 RepID=UPI00386EA607